MPKAYPLLSLPAASGSARADGDTLVDAELSEVGAEVIGAGASLVEPPTTA
jgi:hypothetical protein